MSEAFFIMTCHERHRLYRINAANDGDFVGFIWFDEDCNAWVFELVNSNFHFTAPALQEILEFMQGLEGYDMLWKMFLEMSEKYDKDLMLECMVNDLKGIRRK